MDRSGGWDDAVRLAERLRAPVYSSPASERAGFPEDHPQFMGALPFAIGPMAEKVTTPVDKSTGFYGLSTGTLLSQCGSALWLLR